MILPGDKVVVFTNGTFSAIDGLTIRMKASTNEDLAAEPFNPKPKNVITIGTPHGKSVTGDVVDKALAEHKPRWASIAHWRRAPDVKRGLDCGAALQRISPVVAPPRFPSANEPCLRLFETAIRRHDLRRKNACLRPSPNK